MMWEVFSLSLIIICEWLFCIRLVFIFFNLAPVFEAVESAMFARQSNGFTYFTCLANSEEGRNGFSIFNSLLLGS